MEANLEAVSPLALKERERERERGKVEAVCQLLWMKWLEAVRALAGLRES